MLLVLVASLALLSAPPASNAAAANTRPSQATQQLFSSEDTAAERELLELANRDRHQAGLPPLRSDQSLTAAARAHAQLMVSNAQLEHQFSGEPSLLQRIGQVSALRLDRAGENIADDSCAEGAEESFMHSPPHRRNLLDPGFNVAGFAAIRSHGHLYVVQDFGHEVSTHTVAQTRELVSHAIGDIRSDAGLRALHQYAPANLDDKVCSVAQAGLANARLLQTAYDNRRIITYTQSRPEILPPAAVSLLRDHQLSQFAVGSCFTRSANYPTGIYWVAILLY